MVLCKFFQQGNCRFGTSCRFEHTRAGDNRDQSANRFGALSGGARGPGGGGQDLLEKYAISTDMIEKDLTAERPQWILSAYGPGRAAPDQLFGGYPREQSFEEMRLHYLSGKAAGNEQQALSQAQELYTTAEQQIQTALQNSRQAANYIVEGENRHPNRLDTCTQGTQGSPFGEFLVGKRPKSLVPDTSSANPFSSGNTSSPLGGGAAQPSAFGQPSSLGQRPNPFGQPQTSTFGQPSQPGPAASPFGQPQAPAPAPSAFGQPTQTTSAFGQPSALGAKPNPFGTPSFGQPSQPAAQGNAFGQPSQLGQKPNPFASTATTTSSPFAAAGNNANNAPASNPFGSASNNNTASASPFGNTGNNNNNPPASNPFGSAATNQGNASANAFGSNTNNQNAAARNPFGQTAQTAQTTQSASPFGQPAAAAPANPFGSANQNPTPDAGNPFSQQQQQQANGAFGQPSSGGNAFSQNTANPFGKPAAASAPANPFGAPQTQQPQQKQAGASGNPYPPGSAKQHPPIDSYSSKGMDGRLVMFKDKQVTYKDVVPGIKEFTGAWKRIWFPDGPPSYYKDTELNPEEYDEKSKAEWAAFAQTGTFQGGLMPELPPPREATRWDF